MLKLNGYDFREFKAVIFIFNWVDLESAYTAYQGAIISDQSQDTRTAAILRLKLSQDNTGHSENNDTEADNVDEKSGEWINESA